MLISYKIQNASVVTESIETYIDLRERKQDKYMNEGCRSASFKIVLIYSNVSRFFVHHIVQIFKQKDYNFFLIIRVVFFLFLLLRRDNGFIRIHRLVFITIYNPNIYRNCLLYDLQLILHLLHSTGCSYL